MMDTRSFSPFLDDGALSPLSPPSQLPTEPSLSDAELLPSSAFNHAPGLVHSTLEEMFHMPSQFYLDESTARTGPLSPNYSYHCLPPTDITESSSPTACTPFLSSFPDAASPSPSASPADPLAPYTPEALSAIIAPNPFAFQFGSEPELDDDELDAYVDFGTSKISAQASASAAPDSPKIPAAPGHAETEQFNSPTIPAAAEGQIPKNKGLSVPKRGKKRARRQAREEEKENSEPEEPITGPSTATASQPPRKRARTEEVLQDVLFPTDGPEKCGLRLNEGDCPHKLARSGADGEHLNQHVGYDGSGVIRCTWPGCTAKYKKPDGLTRHVKDKHWGWKFVCRGCGSDFGRHDLLKKHQKSCP